METVFKNGDKVFDITFGWGIVKEIRGTSYPVKVIFNNGRDTIYTLDGRINEYLTQTLSFTEYTLNGFSQKRPIELPEVGEEIMVSNHFDNPHGEWFLRTFKSYIPTLKYPVETNSGEYKFFKRLR